MRVLFLTTIVAPFQVETAVAARDAGLDYHVAFCEGLGAHRGRHWQIDLSRDFLSARNTTEAPQRFIERCLAAVRPDVVLVGNYRHLSAKLATRYRRQHPDVTLGFWAEQLYPTNRVAMAAKRGWLRWALRHFDLTLGIGDRAWAQYARVMGHRRSFLVPYGPDLSPQRAVERKPLDGPVRFLFSGRLVAQHNLANAFAALARVATERPGELEFTVAASGPVQEALDATLARCPELAAATRYDRDYDTWNDRIRPFAHCDVLLYPSVHAGWGLVVPEAMAAGMVVIASRGVESARYLVTPGVDGLFCDLSVDGIEAAIRWCLDHKAGLREMGLRAREASRRGDAREVGSALATVLRTVRSGGAAA